MSDSTTQQLIDIGRWIDGKGWCPATGGNFSLRRPQGALVTRSGCHKGRLSEDDFIQVDWHGRASDLKQKPSAETLVHLCLYQRDDSINAVLHTHSTTSTVLSRLTTSDWLRLSGFEMQKSLSGNLSHDAEISIAIFDNTQDMQSLAQTITQRWQTSPLHWGLLVRGHGLYAWGNDLPQAQQHLEGLEFLMSCALEMQRLKAIQQ